MGSAHDKEVQRRRGSKWEDSGYESSCQVFMAVFGFTCSAATELTLSLPSVPINILLSPPPPAQFHSFPASQIQDSSRSLSSPNRPPPSLCIPGSLLTGPLGLQENIWQTSGSNYRRREEERMAYFYQAGKGGGEEGGASPVPRNSDPPHTSHRGPSGCPGGAGGGGAVGEGRVCVFPNFSMNPLKRSGRFGGGGGKTSSLPPADSPHSAHSDRAGKAALARGPRAAGSSQDSAQAARDRAWECPAFPRSGGVGSRSPPGRVWERSGRRLPSGAGSSGPRLVAGGG